MARLADRIWEMTWFPPQLLCYKPAFRTEEHGGFSAGRMRTLMEGQRNLVAESVVYAADAVAECFYRTALRDRDLRIQDFPALAVPESHAFIEFRRPFLRDPDDAGRGERVAQSLPHWWGWHVSRHAPADYRRIFRQGDVDPACAAGLSCILWLSHDDKSFFAPVAAVGLKVSGDGEPLGPPVQALGFDHDPERVHDQANLPGWFYALFLPAAMTLAFLACRSTRVVPSSAQDRLDRARARKGKRPLVAYREIDCAMTRDILRYEGMIGVQGLAGAMRHCRHHFVQDMRDRSSLVVLPGVGR